MSTSRQLSLANVAINKDFLDLKDFQPALQGEASTDWRPEMMRRVPIWSGLELDSAQSIKLGGEWLEDIINGNISTKTVVIGLRLAHSLKSMNPGNAVCLLRQPDRPVETNDTGIARVALPDITSFSTVPFATRTASVPTVQTPANPAQQVPSSGSSATPPTPPAEDSETAIASSYCFMAMYMMKLLVKSPENVFRGADNMKSKYYSFYGPSRLMTETIIPIVRMMEYKEAVISQSNILTSYTVSIAHTHQNVYRTLDQREQGVLAYLCFIPFAYTGLHAYTLLIDIMGITKVSLDRLLSLFLTDITGPALKKIGVIVRTYEKTLATPNVDITFRYCAMWGAHFFAEARSKNCPHLIFLLASTYKQLSSSGEFADPENIAAVRVLSAPMKATLRRLAGDAAGALKENMLSGPESSILFNTAGTAVGGTIAPAGMPWDTLAGTPPPQ